MSSLTPLWSQSESAIVMNVRSYLLTLLGYPVEYLGLEASNTHPVFTVKQLDYGTYQCYVICTSTVILILVISSVLCIWRTKIFVPEVEDMISLLPACPELIRHQPT